jgi:hypothetical protein
VSLPQGIVSGLTAFSISTWVYLNTEFQHTRIFDFGTGASAYMFLTPYGGTGVLGFDPYLNGKIDNFRIYNRALSATEVQQLFQQQL